MKSITCSFFHDHIFPSSPFPGCVERFDEFLSNRRTGIKNSSRISKRVADGIVRAFCDLAYNNAQPHKGTPAVQRRVRCRPERLDRERLSSVRARWCCGRVCLRPTRPTCPILAKRFGRCSRARRSSAQAADQRFYLYKIRVCTRTRRKLKTREGCLLAHLLAGTGTCSSPGRPGRSRGCT